MSGQNPKVAVVGAGSRSFGLSVLKGLLFHEGLPRLHLHLHDVDEPAAARLGELGRFLIQERKLPRTIDWGRDLSRALDGADVVVVSVAVDREAAWQKDRETALRFGINHYAENGGPASIFHAARNIALVLPVAQEMRRLCPHALMLNYTNPVPRICTAVARYAGVRVLGVCHQIDFGYYVAGVLMSAELGIRLPPEFYFRWNDESMARHDALISEGRRELSILAAGLNHFSFALAILARRDGRDLYPLLRERNRTFDPGFEPLTRKVFELFGHFPIPGDTHLSEFLPFTHNVSRRTWERCDIQMYDFDWSRARREKQDLLAHRIMHDRQLDLMEHIGSERTELLVEAFLQENCYLDEALNLPNCGCIPNLPEGAIVEVPVVFGPGGPVGRPVAALPEAVAELCRRQVAITELSVAGTVEGDRGKLLQALALDPMIDDPDLPLQLLEAYLLDPSNRGGCSVRR
jgi:alpha-galactosidase